MKLSAEILNEIENSLENLNFGEIVLSVHQGRIVQMERNEKKRF